MPTGEILTLHFLTWLTKTMTIVWHQYSILQGIASSLKKLKFLQTFWAMGIFILFIFFRSRLFKKNVIWKKFNFKYLPLPCTLCGKLQWNEPKMSVLGHQGRRNICNYLQFQGAIDLALSHKSSYLIVMAQMMLKWTYTVSLWLKYIGKRKIICFKLRSKTHCCLMENFVTLKCFCWHRFLNFS